LPVNTFIELFVKCSTSRAVHNSHSKIKALKIMKSLNVLGLHFPV